MKWLGDGTLRSGTRNILGMVLGAAILMFGGDCFAQGIRVSVCTFQNLTGEAANDGMGHGLVDHVQGNVRKISGIELVETEQLNKLLDIIKLSASGMTEEKTAIKTGKLLGIQYLIMGNFQSADGELAVSCRMVEVETGRILFNDIVKGDAHRIIALEEKVGKRVRESIKAEFPSLLADRAGLPAPDAPASPVDYDAVVACALKSNPDEGVESFQKLIEGNPDCADAYLGQGDIYLREGNATQALEKFNRALTLYHGKDDRFFVGWTYYKMGEAYFIQGDHDRSAVYFREALDIKKQMGNDVHIPAIYSRLSTIARQKSQTAPAIEYLKKAVVETAKLGDKHKQMALLIDLTLLYREAGLPALTDKTFKSAVKLSKEIRYREIDRLYVLSLELHAKKGVGALVFAGKKRGI